MDRPLATSEKRKTSLSLNADALDAARTLGVNVSAVADAALTQAIAAARQKEWLKENADALAAQAKWHGEHAHPLADIMMGPAAASWND